ncbi:HET-domain-containing protein [Karstenula rhodostoma CBS 690.94]|uniref:HET-domain-containing protein n=1 Tax=Karstenula rhodostoma CBS 690.94 TaxID=1392251 RepID=A0A9P4PNL5_9PLEO|nr:HET-domain-containing protein [Karstenula rhodostoma CBS 690.94]
MYPADLPQRPQTFKDTPEYRCLSYTWGEPPEDHRILVNEHIFQVRKNLFEFLELATEVYPDEPLWIDALCISHINTQEKSHQVQRMGTIYENATEVVVWLGKRLTDERMWSKRGLRSFLETRIFSRGWTWEPGLCDGMLQLSRQYGTEYVVRAICEHPYWTRAWIAQEILLQDNIVILVGCEKIEWDRFGQVL